MVDTTLKRTDQREDKGPGHYHPLLRKKVKWEWADHVTRMVDTRELGGRQEQQRGGPGI